MWKAETKIILASSSPRRAELLTVIGVNFEAVPGDVQEQPLSGETPPDYITRLARAKAFAAARKCENGLIIGADTIVVVDDIMLGKPKDKADAARMLKMLSDKWHSVMTGVALYDIEEQHEIFDHCKTLVRFVPLSDEEIDWYIESGEPMDKAGAYAIQGRGGLFVEEIEGNYFNVVGFPLVHRLARKLGHSLLM